MRRSQRGEAGIVALALACFLSVFCECSHRPFQGREAEASGALSWLLGDWRGFRSEPSSGERAPVVSRIEPILSGAGEQESIDISTSKGMYHGLYTEVTEPASGKSVIIYVNSNRRSFARLEGRATAQGGEWMNTATDGSHRSRLVYERPTDRTWRRT